MLATGSLVSSTTAFRMAVACSELIIERTPPLALRALTASFGGRDTRRAEAAFRDDLLALARDSAEVSWREIRRGLDAFDAFTRPGPDNGAPPHRSNRVKL